MVAVKIPLYTAAQFQARKFDSGFKTAGEGEWEPGVGFNVSLTT